MDKRVPSLVGIIVVIVLSFILALGIRSYILGLLPEKELRAPEIKFERGTAPKDKTEPENNRAIKEQTDRKNGIHTGKYEYPLDHNDITYKVLELERALMEGHQPWRIEEQDPKLVLRIEGSQYGFSFTDQEIEQMSPFWEDGVAKYFLSHREGDLTKYYVITLTVLPDDLRWVISAIQEINFR